MELVFGLRGLFFALGAGTYLLLEAQPLFPPALLVMALIGGSSKLIGNYQREYKILETESLSRSSQLAQEKL